MAKQGFQKGKPKTGGRKKGVPNKVDSLSRELVQKLIEGQFVHVEAALNKIRNKKPDRYLDIIFSLLEYCLPKLSRTELTGKDGEKLNSINLSALTAADLQALKEIRDRAIPVKADE